MLAWVRSRFAATSVALVAAALAGCSRSPTAPRPPAIVTRATAIVVTDTLGAGAPSLLVALGGPPDNHGLAQTRFPVTDATGIARDTLSDGTWVGVCFQGGLVAGCTFPVPGANRPANDTVLVHLRLARPAQAHGHAALSDGHNPSSISISSNGTLFPGACDSTGAWSLGGLPPGDWTIWFTGFGYATAQRIAHVSAPGDSVSVPDVVLTPALP